MNKELLQRLDSGWRNVFTAQLDSDYMRQLYQFLEDEIQSSKVIYPPTQLWYNAFLQTPLNRVKVVIIGQDPYHGPGQAHGLSFSVPEGIAYPPSLKNIFKELYGSQGVPESGDLSAWARQGVLLLNSSLTVEQGLPGSHAKKGWMTFTSRCLQAINDQCEHVVFLAWGRFAQAVCSHIDLRKHVLLKTSHPSPLGATKSGQDFKAFMGSGCFDEVNDHLQAWGSEKIDWRTLG